MIFTGGEVETWVKFSNNFSTHFYLFWWCLEEHKRGRFRDLKRVRREPPLCSFEVGVSPSLQREFE